jgi:hypothetical protein
MHRYIISSFIVFVMIAAVFLAWTPQTKAGAVPSLDCCDTQLDFADCFCATKFGGWVREVPCTAEPVCNTDPSSCSWECNIQPVRCKPWEEGKVLQRFVDPTTQVSALVCSPCDGECASMGGL